MGRPHMSLEEAAGANVLISYLAGKHDQLPPKVLEAVVGLARRAHMRLQHGWDAGDVLKHWAPELQDVTPRDQAPV